MNPNDMPDRSSIAAHSELSASDKHCVFRSGGSWFSVPAVSVREITIAPDLVEVPQCHPAMAGMCHLRSEFIPVISLSAILDVEPGLNASPENKLMVMGGRSVWAMLIAEAAALESLETVIAPDARGDEVNQSPVMGTAMCRDQIVRVLDPSGIFRRTEQQLGHHWNRQQQPHQPPRCEEGSLA